MHLEEFAEGTSLLHRMDPRAKILTLVPLVVVTALSRGLEAPLLSLAVSFLLTLIARLSFRGLLSRLLVVNTFVLLLWVFLPFSYHGREVFSIGPFTITREGLIYTLSITVKTNAIVLSTIAMLGTSEIFSIAHALLHLRAPQKLIYLFFFFYRYISVLHEEYTRLRRAMTVRCFSAGTGLHTYRSIAYLVGMLLVRSYERSQRIYQAMLCRGFDGTFPVVRHFRFTPRDGMFSLIMLLLTVAIMVIG